MSQPVSDLSEYHRTPNAHLLIALFHHRAYKTYFLWLLKPIIIEDSIAMVIFLFQSKYADAEQF